MGLSAAIDFPGYFLEGITPEILIRIGLAAVAGTVLGIEREKHGRAAGLRTTLMVCLASCIAMIISDAFYQHSFVQQATAGGWHPDPARLAAGVLSGMGFLGAGVIIRQSNHMVRGVTTAATLWFVTIIGLAFGAGSIGVGLLATVGSVLILVLIPHVESLVKNDWYSDLGVSFSTSACTVDLLVAAILPLGVKVKGIDVVEDLADDRSEVVLHLRYKRKSMVKFTADMTAAIRKVGGVTRISFKS